MSTKDWLEKDYYAILGVDKDADSATIKKAYRGLARELHPDHNKNNKEAEGRFKDVSEAYSVLSNAGKRKEYDEARALFSGGVGGRPNGSASSFDFDLGDVFGGRSGGSGGLGDVFGGLFGGRDRARSGVRRGADVEREVAITFTEAVEGKTIPLKLTTSAACPTCAGTGARAGTVPRVCVACSGAGFVSTDSGGFGMTEPCRDCRGRGLIVDDPCPVCHGSGRGTSSRTMQVRIPAGVRDQQRIRLRGKGAPGSGGGPAGDLYVVVNVGSHPIFGRRGEHLTVTVPVTFPEAALGAEIKVPTLSNGPVTLRLPAGTPNGRTFRVRGRGATRRNGSRGDLLVTVEVSVPTRISSDAKKALEDFQAATTGDDVRARLMGAVKGQ